MPTFDVVSEVDMQEVKNAVDQANREATTRFDFKGTDSTIELTGEEIILESATEDRLKALNQVLEEKLVRRQVSLSPSTTERSRKPPREGPASGRRSAPGSPTEHGKKINKLVKDMGLKGVSSQVQGDQVRVSGKKRDDLQAVIRA